MKPRLLFLAQSLPYPPRTGVATRTFNVLRQLSTAFDIDLVAFYRRSHHADETARVEAWEALRQVAAQVAEPVAIANEHSGVRTAWDHLRSLITGRAYTFYEYDSPVFRQQLRAALRRGLPDLVHLDSLDLHRWLPELPPVPVACTHHDIDSALLRRRALALPQGPLRQYLLLQAWRVEGVERDLCPQMALNVVMSELDAERLRALAPGATTLVAPNGTDTEYFKPNGVRSVPGQVVFVGPTISQPNRDAVEYLLREIWPRIHAAESGAALHLVGRAPADDRARYDAEPGVTTLGEVADLRPALGAARCCVVPIRIGGGTRLKILDAWSMGKAVVSTSVGCEGLDAVDGENILIRDQPDALAAAVVQVLTDDGLRARLEANARRTASATYSWAAVGERLRSGYRKLLQA